MTPLGGNCFLLYSGRREMMLHLGLCSAKGSWNTLVGSFCKNYFPPPHIVILRMDILNFQQGENESLGVVWERFSRLVKSCPILSIPKHVTLQHFYVGLDKEFNTYLDMSSGGSFSLLKVPRLR
jgi:hypothetical protein